MSTPITLAVVADLEGVLEPCGCSVRPAGGMDRLAASIARLRESYGPVLIAVGGHLLFPPKSGASRTDARLALAQDQLKAEAMGALLAQLRPSVLVPGPADRRLGASALRSLEVHGVPILTGTEGPQVEGLKHTDRSRLVAHAGRRVGFLAAPGSSEESAAEVTGLRAEGASLLVAFQQRAADAPIEWNDVDVVVHTGTDRAAVVVDEATLHLYPGRHGEELWLLRLWPGTDSRAPWELRAEVREISATHRVAVVERHLLDAATQRDPDVRAQLDQAFARIQALASTSVLDESPLEDPQRSSASYVGSNNCAPCHAEAFFWWKANAHGRAFASLVSRGRSLDLVCVGCHVTGFGEPGGASLGKLADLRDVGCESCHGPGGRHVDQPSERPSNIERAPGPSVCVACHDAEHSVGFVYEQGRAALRDAGHGVPSGSLMR